VSVNIRGISVAGAEAFGFALIICFSAIGLLFGYLYTRLFLQGAFGRADQSSRIKAIEDEVQEAKEKLNAAEKRTEEIESVVNPLATRGASNAIENPNRAEQLSGDQLTLVNAAGDAASEKSEGERSEEEWWIMANSAFQRKDYPRALLLAREALRRFPQKAWKYWNFLGLVNHWTQPQDRPPNKNDDWFKAAIDAYERAENDPFAASEQRLLSRINRMFVYYDAYDYQSVFKEMEQVFQTVEAGGKVNPPLLDLARIIRAAARVHEEDQDGAADDLNSVQAPNNFTYLIRNGDIRRESIELWKLLPNLTEKAKDFVSAA